MKSFPAREKEILTTLKQLRHIEAVLIGGYAMSAYASPRFSVDCDLVVKDKIASSKIALLLRNQSYTLKETNRLSYGGSFQRFEKTLEDGLRASFDILIGGVLDRRTDAFFTADWIFKHSTKKPLRGRMFIEPIDFRVVDLDALIVLKLVASRNADLRDVFMLLPQVKNFEAIRTDISEKTSLHEALEHAKVLITSTEFKKNLGGVYGFVNEATFNRHIQAFEKLAGKAKT